MLSTSKILPAKNKLITEIDTLYTSEFAMKAMHHSNILTKINIVIANFDREFKKAKPVFDDETLGFDLEKKMDFQAQTISRKPKQNFMKPLRLTAIRFLRIFWILLNSTLRLQIWAKGPNLVIFRPFINYYIKTY